MAFLFLSLEQVCIALGAGSAFIFSSFFILSVKDHIVKPHEYAMLKSLSLFSLVSACIGIVTFVINSAIYLESAVDFRIGLISAKLIIFSLALVSEMTLRKIHLPNLMRHQKTYFHLSDTMVHHPDPRTGWCGPGVARLVRAGHGLDVLARDPALAAIGPDYRRPAFELAAIGSNLQDYSGGVAAKRR